MSFKRESMPSINESDNEEEESLSLSGEISTSDYASLNRQKNATLKKDENDVTNPKGEIMEKDSTLKQINMISLNLSDEHFVDTSQLNNSELSFHSLDIGEGDDEDEKNTHENSIDHTDITDITTDTDKLENGQSESLTTIDYSETDRFGFLKGNQYTEPNKLLFDDSVEWRLTNRQIIQRIRRQRQHHPVTRTEMAGNAETLERLQNKETQKTRQTLSQGHPTIDALPRLAISLQQSQSRGHDSGAHVLQGTVEGAKTAGNVSIEFPQQHPGGEQFRLRFSEHDEQLFHGDPVDEFRVSQHCHEVAASRSV